MLRTLEGVQAGVQRGAAGTRSRSPTSSCSAAASASSRPPQDAGHDVEVPFTPGRIDATQEQTDVESFASLEPTRRRVPQLPRQGAPAAGRVPARRPGEPAHPERAGDDRPRRRPARPRRQHRRLAARRPHRPPGHADATTSSSTCSTSARRGRRRPRTRETFEARDAPRRGQVDRHAGSTWSSARTPSCAPSPRSTPATTRRRSSCSDFVAAWTKVMDLDR